MNLQFIILINVTGQWWAIICTLLAFYSVDRLKFLILRSAWILLQHYKLKRLWVRFFQFLRNQIIYFCISYHDIALLLKAVLSHSGEQNVTVLMLCHGLLVILPYLKALGYYSVGLCLHFCYPENVALEPMTIFQIVLCIKYCYLQNIHAAVDHVLCAALM